MAENQSFIDERFLVCGLGGLGQHCVVALKQFGVKVVGIELVQPNSWRIPGVDSLLDDLIIGDCRDNSVFERAKIELCRAVLIVTSDELINAETAIAVRQLNKNARLVIRSTKENLNQLLEEHLSNFVAYDPIYLSAASFALAALGGNSLGYFNLDGNWLGVFQHQVSSGDNFHRRQLFELNSSSRMLLCYLPNDNDSFNSFYDWDSETIIQDGATLIYVQEFDRLLSKQPKKSANNNPKQKQISPKSTNIRKKLLEYWDSSSQVRRVVIISVFVTIILAIVGTILFNSLDNKDSIYNAFYITISLLLGGYPDFLYSVTTNHPIQQIVALSLAVAGTAFVGVLYALATEKLLSTKFLFSKRRTEVPQQEHIVIIGIKRVGSRVTKILQDFYQPVVGIVLEDDFDNNKLPDITLFEGDLNESLTKVNLSTAKSIIATTEDEILNVEIALKTRKINPESNLVIRTFGQRLSENLAQILPSAQIISAYAVASEAFAGAAFGENILDLFRFHNQTVLVTEYQFTEVDTLNDLLLSEIAYGYGVVPILYQKPGIAPEIMPKEYRKIQPGIRLVVLATIDGLKRMEAGRIGIYPKNWQIVIESAITQEAKFEGANQIVKLSNYPFNKARDLINNLPQTLPVPLYKLQAQSLIRVLQKCQVMASLKKIGGDGRG
ncbi:NAD-binding protein [Plectonema cf. radiosum LEGE 06105]|uniref:NAD-binding protein n=1 Tax=Plectonema cf. radiosum LEGE 06105 TaxID=945769 RepID=A0A8J7F321_9CYAN|nr:NAD-binding protein [Plectonema radiosum]MBE9215278.1 NAD-binding protein [Plectonema cf. radiosum LEGE 06105]